MNNFNAELKDLIYVNKQVIPTDVCDSVLENINQKEWEKHRWNNKNNYQFSYDTKELDVQEATPDLDGILAPYILQTIDNYIENYFFDPLNSEGLISKFCPLRFNRYSEGQMMRQHCDHITTLFDGNERGIPVLSIVLNLNDDYEGGELYFWNDYNSLLGKGDIVIFPSGFLFPHGVKEVVKGKRYSAVSWVW
jgi:predicted 2-oxoglutarate/Fe(II)-dependent dioxygenase YbiX